MLRLIWQSILWGAGFIAALFIAEEDAAFPVYQLVVALVAMAVASALIWYAPLLWRRFRG